MRALRLLKDEFDRSGIPLAWAGSDWLNRLL